MIFCLGKLGLDVFSSIRNLILTIKLTSTLINNQTFNLHSNKKTPTTPLKIIGKDPLQPILLKKKYYLKHKAFNIYMFFKI